MNLPIVLGRLNPLVRIRSEDVSMGMMKKQMTKRKSALQSMRRHRTDDCSAPEITPSRTSVHANRKARALLSMLTLLGVTDSTYNYQ